VLSVNLKSTNRSFILTLCVTYLPLPYSHDGVLVRLIVDIELINMIIESQMLLPGTDIFARSSACYMNVGRMRVSRGIILPIVGDEQAEECGQVVWSLYFTYRFNFAGGLVFVYT